ncbi:uncharacterized protein LOC134233089 isoform X2 [Saccostrea cucullata]|uniref:uncharacterized protein LOC134233089 isoform X2 n=1 Tax=Saccostrea cuccullata TaxID=36930 RepID=UPI002ED5D185
MKTIAVKDFSLRKFQMNAKNVIRGTLASTVPWHVGILGMANIVRNNVTVHRSCVTYQQGVSRFYYNSFKTKHCLLTNGLLFLDTHVGHNLKSPKTANELQENKSSESRKGNEDWKTASHGQLTPILIGIIAFLTFLLFAIGGRMIWKKVQQSNPKIVQRTLEIQSLDRKLNKTKENEEAKENFYEDIDGLKAGESSKDILSSENDYIDKLDFVEKEKSDNRESNHFYDALK